MPFRFLLIVFLFPMVVAGQPDPVTSSTDTCAVIIPNSISPNGALGDSVLRARINCPLASYELTIYNRWGRELLSTTDPKAYWDYKKVEAGTYLYVLKGQFANGSSFENKGSVTAIH